MTRASVKVTSVTICNRTYNVRSGDDPEYVRRLAEYVDQKMVELAQGTATVDTLKVAVLAALNIADDCFVARRQLAALQQSVTGRADRMSALIEEALADGSA